MNKSKAIKWLNVIETLKKENKKAYLHTLPFQVWVGQQQAKIFLSLALYYVNLISDNETDPSIHPTARTMFSSKSQTEIAKSKL